MSEDHATPPTAEDRARIGKALNTARLVAIFAVVGVLWLLMEIGGAWAENLAVVVFVVAALVIWWRQR